MPYKQNIKIVMWQSTIQYLSGMRKTTWQEETEVGTASPSLLTLIVSTIVKLYVHINGRKLQFAVNCKIYKVWIK